MLFAMHTIDIDNVNHLRTAVTTRLKFEQTSIRIRDVKSLQTFVNI